MEELPDELLTELLLFLDPPSALSFSCASARPRRVLLALRPRLAPALADCALDPATNPYRLTPAFFEHCLILGYLSLILWAENEQGSERGLSLPSLLPPNRPEAFAPFSSALFNAAGQSNRPTVAYLLSKQVSPLPMLRSAFDQKNTELIPDLLRAVGGLRQAAEEIGDGTLCGHLVALKDVALLQQFKKEVRKALDLNDVGWDFAMQSVGEVNDPELTQLFAELFGDATKLSPYNYGLGLAKGGHLQSLQQNPLVGWYSLAIEACAHGHLPLVQWMYEKYGPPQLAHYGWLLEKSGHAGHWPIWEFYQAKGLPVPDSKLDFLIHGITNGSLTLQQLHLKVEEVLRSGEKPTASTVASALRAGCKVATMRLLLDKCDIPAYLFEYKDAIRGGNLAVFRLLLQLRSPAGSPPRVDFFFCLVEALSAMHYRLATWILRNLAPPGYLRSPDECRRILGTFQLNAKVLYWILTNDGSCDQHPSYVNATLRWELDSLDPSDCTYFDVGEWDFEVVPLLLGRSPRRKGVELKLLAETDEDAPWPPKTAQDLTDLLKRESK